MAETVFTSDPFLTLNAGHADNMTAAALSVPTMGAHGYDQSIQARNELIEGIHIIIHAVAE